MADLRIIVVLALVIAWWQKDTLEDRALTQEGITAAALQTASRAWSSSTLPSPAKAWTNARDLWLDDLFNPKKDYSHQAVEHALVAVGNSASTPSSPASEPVVALRADPPHAQIGKGKDFKAFEKNTPRDSNGGDNVPLSTPLANGSSLASNTIDPSIKRILIVGDSMVGDVGISLRQLAFKHRQKTGVDIQIIDAHRHSTGLVVPSYYDWPRELPVLLTRNEPQVVVFMAGANDGQSMRLDNKSWVLPGSTGWANEYERRAKQVIAAVPVTSKLVWLDLPPVRTQSLQEKTFMVNGSVKSALAMCQNCLHLETRSTFGGDAYVENTPGSTLRSKDGVHYSRSGAAFVAAQLWTKLGFPLYDR